MSQIELHFRANVATSSPQARQGFSCCWNRSVIVRSTSQRFGPTHILIRDPPHQRITTEALKDLDEAVAFTPLHDPGAIAVIRMGMERFPDFAHYACFDTVFHRPMPVEASTYPTNVL
ncbi:MAG: hypothetical protein ABI197_05330 [Granulicella sp.]